MTFNSFTTSVSDTFHFDMDPDPTGKYQLLFYFFFYKKCISQKYDLFCYLWGKYLVSKHKFDNFEKNV